ncbi:MAG: CocE/NonD family hydrolase [Acidobacteriota bacterium]|nr:CocE/NonD family hydrolase [Acidobacteriota bacterium]
MIETLDVAMRDGVKLRADLLMPATHGPFPVLIYRTPYGRKSAEKYYTTFRRAVERGYAVLIQDVRGRYDSGGEFRPYENEGHDGFDTIEWAAKQSWSNGDIGTFGLSYPGAVQWLAAVENPPHLKAMAPAMTFSTPQNFFYAGGSWDLSWIEWIWDNIAPDIRAKKNLPGPISAGEAAKAWEKDGSKMLAEVPLDNLAELRDIAPYYYDWLRHPPEDPWWDWAELRNKYSNVHAAVLNLSAWYDDNYGPEGATTNFKGLLGARKSGDARTHLLLGPWVHGGTRENKAGDRDFGASAAIDYDEIVLRWMDRYLRGIDNGVDREAPARYYVMGADEWRESKTWPPPAKMTPYYLAAGANAGSTSTAGTLSKPAPVARKNSSSFISDPEHPVTNKYSSAGAHDYRDLAGRSDTLTFDSPSLQADTEVTGPIDAEIYMSCDCRDADLWVRLLDVAPDGTALNLMSPGLDVVRASYREPARGRQLLQPNRAYLIGLKNLITSNVFKKDHRIRVQISGSFFPNFSRNPQTGDSERNSGAFKKSKVTIHSDRGHPSRIILPVATARAGS